MSTHESAESLFDGSRLLCSIREAARALSLSDRMVLNYIAAKRLVSRKVGRRRLISVASLKAFALKDQPGLAPWSGSKGAGQ
jgi:excisionase family DNA binding protein